MQKPSVSLFRTEFSEKVCLSFHLGLKRPEIGVGIKSKAGVTAGRTAAATCCYCCAALIPRKV